MEREKPAISLGGQDEPDLSYMYGGTYGEGEPLNGTALIASGPAAFKHKPSAGNDSVTILVDSGASGHYFDDLIIPSLKHRLLTYFLLTIPRKILTAGGALLEGTAEGILKGLVTDNHREQHLARIAFLIVSGIGCNLFYVKMATKKSVVSIFDFYNPRLELSDITVPLHAEDYVLLTIPTTKPPSRYSYSSLQPPFHLAAVSSLGEPIRVVNTPAKTSKRIARRQESLNSSRLPTRHNKSAVWNALDGWSGTCVLTAGYRLFFGGSS